MTLQYSSGFVTITPTHPIPLGGYVNRTEPYLGIADDLEANAVILHDDTQMLVFISFDLLYVGGLLRRKLEDALQAWVQPEQLFLAASHSHFAPATDPTLPLLGEVVPAYVEMVVERVTSLVNSLVRAEFKPLEIRVGQVQADNAVNRRRTGWRFSSRYPFLRNDVQMRPNPGGAKDETVRVLRLGLNAVIWNYACHPVFVPWMNHVSADFVGVARKVLRNKLGAETAVLFWQGFSGDVYPSFSSTMLGLTAKLKRRLFRIDTVVASDVWQHWAERLAMHVSAATDRAVLAPNTGPILARRVSIPLSDLLEGDTSNKLVTAHKISIGNDLNVLGISAECVTEYGMKFRSAMTNEHLFCVGCIDGVFGYLPTTPMLHEGGYEAADFLPFFSLKGKFYDRLEGILHDRLLDLVSR